MLSQILTLEAVQELADDKFFERGRHYADEERVRTLVERGQRLTAVVAGSEDYEVRLWVASKGTTSGGLGHACTCPVGQCGDFCKHCVAVALTWLEAREAACSAPESSAMLPESKASKASGASLKSPEAATMPAPRAAGKSTKTNRAAARIVRLDDVRPWLLTRDAATLADLLLDAAERDGRLRERLLRQAAAALGQGVDFSAYRAAITRATAPHGYVSYYEAGGFAREIAEAVEPLRELLREGHAGAVIGLAEHALARVEKAIEHTDDSDGCMNGILDDLQALHLEACRAARPEPVELAERLFQRETGENGFGLFYNAVTTYADVLGEPGRARYRALAEAAWERLPALEPGSDGSFSSNRRRLTGIMETLTKADAERGGDVGTVDALVKIKAKDLSKADQFLAIARLYAQAGRHDDALAWAERGLAAFKSKRGYSWRERELREFTAGEYHYRERHEEAMALIWEEFEHAPSLHGYQCLKEHAERAKAWPVWRERALERLRPTSKTKKSTKETKGVKIAKTTKNIHGFRAIAFSFSKEPAARKRDASELVAVRLWEGDAETAWQEAQAWGCGEALWLELATQRKTAHPQDALPIYQRTVGQLIDQTHPAAYEQAVAFLKKIKPLMERMEASRMEAIRGEADGAKAGCVETNHTAEMCRTNKEHREGKTRQAGKAHDTNEMHDKGLPASWPAYLAGLREKHQRKRNFIALCAGL